MTRGTAIFLVVLTSLSLGHAPCCVVPSPCWEKHAGATERACCPKCAPEPVKAKKCISPEIVGTLELEAEFAPALLPGLLVVAAETAPARTSVHAASSGRVAPPRAGPTLPLLL